MIVIVSFAIVKLVPITCIIEHLKRRKFANTVKRRNNFNTSTNEPFNLPQP